MRKFPAIICKIALKLRMTYISLNFQILAPYKCVTFSTNSSVLWSQLYGKYKCEIF